MRAGQDKHTTSDAEAPDCSACCRHHIAVCAVLRRATPCTSCVQAFFAQIYSEAQSSRAAPGHVAIAELHQLGRLQRHYTLNIDGLAAVRVRQSIDAVRGLCVCLPRNDSACACTSPVNAFACAAAVLRPWLCMQVVGMDTWHNENNPEGITVEMHGNIRSALPALQQSTHKRASLHVAHKEQQQQPCSI